MSIEETIECIKVMQAFVGGKIIESRGRKNECCWASTFSPSWDWLRCDYRIKPTATLRPWTADEVPLGAWMRSKRNPQDRALIQWVSSQCDREMWLDKNEHSTDGGVTWKPCGVVEEAK